MMEEFNSIYRGKVVANYDPEVKGRLKVYVPGVYPELLSRNPENLPWSEPAMPLFGGSYTNKADPRLNDETGVTTIPHVGAELWMFFENGNHMLPRHFAACQGGAGWHSEHKNQHVIKTDNVRIRVDEEPTLPTAGHPEKSTCKFDTYNTKCTELSKQHAKKQVPTRVDIEILNKSAGALNLRITGNVNIQINGDVFEEVNGNRHETLYGNLYRKHVGDLHYEHEGTSYVSNRGSQVEVVAGDRKFTYMGDIVHHYMGDCEFIVDKSMKERVAFDKISRVYGSEMKTVRGSQVVKVTGAASLKSGGDRTVSCNNNYTFATNDIVESSLKGCNYRQCWLMGMPDTPPTPPYLPGSIIDKANAVRSESMISTTEVTNGIFTRQALMTMNDNCPGLINHTNVPTEPPVILQTKSYAMSDIPLMSSVKGLIDGLIASIKSAFPS